MDKEIAQGPIGEVGSYDVEFKNGYLSLKANAAISEGNASLVVNVGAAQVLDALAAAVPGKIDDLLLGILKTALLS